MGHYNSHRSRLQEFRDQLMLTCLGIFFTVIPMQVLDIIQSAIATIAMLLTCCMPSCNRDTVD